MCLPFGWRPLVLTLEEAGSSCSPKGFFLWGRWVGRPPNVGGQCSLGCSTQPSAALSPGFRGSASVTAVTRALPEGSHFGAPSWLLGKGQPGRFTLGKGPCELKVPICFVFSARAFRTAGCSKPRLITSSSGASLWSCFRTHGRLGLVSGEEELAEQAGWGGEAAGCPAGTLLPQRQPGDSAPLRHLLGARRLHTAVFSALQFHTAPFSVPASVRLSCPTSPTWDGWTFTCSLGLCSGPHHWPGPGGRDV